MKMHQAIHRFVGSSRLKRYGLAAVLTILAIIVSGIGVSRFGLAVLPTAGFLIAAAVMTSAWLGGLGPGLMSAFLIPVANLLRVAPFASRKHPVLLASWTAIAIGVAFVVARFRMSTLRAWQRQAMQPLPLWDDDATFNRLMETIQHTLVDRTRCYMLYQVARQTSHIAGDVAEVGVYKGGTAKLLAQGLPHKTVHLFDTFAGMPETNPDSDKHRAGDFSDTSLAAVQQHLKDCGNVRFYQGLFPDTAGPIERVRFSMVHVDADIYESVRACCEFFYPRLEKDAVLVFDDYGFPSCPGARKAVDEFFEDKVEIPFYLPSGQCWVVRK
jgi:O-methyltransferase